MSMPACSNVNQAMQSLSGVAYETSEQHKDVSKARQARDVSDTLNIISYLSERNPFANNPCLHSISNGMTLTRPEKLENWSWRRWWGSQLTGFLSGSLSRW